MQTNGETTLTKERLHWGIITPAVLISFALILATLPILFFIKVTANMVNQLSPQTSHSFPSWIFLWVLLPDLLIFGISIAVTWIAYLTSEIIVTNSRLLFRTGFISRRSGELPLENVESIFVTEPLFGRLSGYGTVTVTSVGGQTFPFHYMRSPQRFYAILQTAVNDAKAPKKQLTKPQGTPQPANDDSWYMPKG